MLALGPHPVIEVDEVSLSLLILEGDEHLELFNRGGTPPEGFGKALAVSRFHLRAEPFQPLHGSREAPEEAGRPPRTAVDRRQIDDSPILPGGEGASSLRELGGRGLVVRMGAIERRPGLKEDHGDD